MVYCTPSDVKIIVKVGDLTDPQITSLIAQTDYRIDKLLGAQSGSNLDIQRLSMLMTAKFIQTNRPARYSLLGTSYDYKANLALWDVEIKKILSTYKSPKGKQSAYQHIDEDVRFEKTAADVSE